MSGLQGGSRSGWVRWGKLGLDKWVREVSMAIVCYTFFGVEILVLRMYGGGGGSSVLPRILVPTWVPRSCTILNKTITTFECDIYI